MKNSGPRQTLLTVMLVLGFSAIGHAQGVVVHAKGGLEAKLEYCKTCHGMSGQGYLGLTFRCRGLPDSSPNTSRLSCVPSSSAGEPIRSCSTSRTS